MVKRSQNERGFQQVSGWQRFPSGFALDGWLRSDHPQAIPHSALSTLLAVYAQLFERNLQQSPTLKEGRVELDLKQLALDAGATNVAEELEILSAKGFVVRGQGRNIEVRDPVSGRWPPSKFAPLPARFVMEHLPQLRTASTEYEIDVGDVLSLYIAMLARRNSKTGEVWYSAETTPSLAGLDSKRAEAALSALMQARLVKRPTLARIWVYQISGLEPSNAETPKAATSLVVKPVRPPTLYKPFKPKTKVKSPLGKKPTPPR